MFSSDRTGLSQELKALQSWGLSPCRAAGLMPHTDLSEAISILLPAELTTRLPWPLQDKYQWLDRRNELAVLALLPALATAWRHDWHHQILLHLERVRDIFNKDRAEYVAALVANTFGYRGFLHHHPHSLFGKTFTVPVGSLSRFASHSLRSETVRRELRFVRLEDYPKVVPSHAFGPVALLDTHRVIPDNYWIADKIDIVTRPIHVDPILCGSFGRWVVGLAEWA